MRKFIAVLLLLGMAATVAMPIAQAGNDAIKPVPLFMGQTISANLGAESPWIDVRGANRVILHTRSGLAPGTGTSPTTAWSLAGDSVYVDSLVTFELYFSDSVSFMARDSAGVLVTSSSGIPATTSHGKPYPVCADSVIVRCTVNPITAANVNSDTSYKFVGVANPPLMEPLKPNITGSGTYTYVVPLQLGTLSMWENGSILPNYMRVKVRPWKRRVITGSTDSTQGVKALRMEALVYRRNF